MMLVDAQASLPFMLIALAVLAFFGNNLTLFVLVMGIHGWEAYARLTRGMVIAASTQGYAVAVRALGAKPATIYFRHILPNIVSVLIIQFTLFFPATILLESSLSFLGLGIQPPLTSLGQMLGAGRSHLMLAWWIAVLPGTMIFHDAVHQHRRRLAARPVRSDAAQSLNDGRKHAMNGRGSGAALACHRTALCADRGDPELHHRRLALEPIRQRRCAAGIERAQHHPIFEVAAVVD
jgi:hypothetical protein